MVLQRSIESDKMHASIAQGIMREKSFAVGIHRGMTVQRKKMRKPSAMIVMAMRKNGRIHK